MISRSAASRAAARTSGFWLRFDLMSSSDAPTTALVAAFVTLRAFFLVLSSSVPFLCILRYSMVHASFRGLNRWWKHDFTLRLMNLNDFESDRAYRIPCPG